MSQQMKAAVMKGIRKVEIENLPVPVPKEDEVLVRIKSVGVCGSDIHYFIAVSYTHLRAHETVLDLVCRLLLEKKKTKTKKSKQVRE